MSVRIASSMRARLKGLLGSAPTADPLLLTPCNDVHTFGMRHPIDVAFITAQGQVLESYRNVGPWRRLRCRRARATLERFSQEGPWYETGDIIELKHSVLDNQKPFK